MTIPDYQTVTFPLLQYASDQKEHSSREAIEYLADHFNLTKEQRQELLPSGTQAVFNNRVGWANTYLKKAGLLESPKRGRLKITSRGLEALRTNPHTINNDFLRQYPEFIEFLSKTKKPTPPVPRVSDQYSPLAPLAVRKRAAMRPRKKRLKPPTKVSETKSSLNFSSKLWDAPLLSLND